MVGFRDLLATDQNCAPVVRQHFKKKISSYGWYPPSLPLGRKKEPRPAEAHKRHENDGTNRRLCYGNQHESESQRSCVDLATRHFVSHACRQRKSQRGQQESGSSNDEIKCAFSTGTNRASYQNTARDADRNQNDA